MRQRPKPNLETPNLDLFRLSKDKAAINRFGFNNDGMHKICARIAGSTNTVPVGLNLGANKNSMNKASDFAKVLEHCRDHIDFATVNVSSPNTRKASRSTRSGCFKGIINRRHASKKISACVPKDCA